jgi:hypothetical protein
MRIGGETRAGGTGMLCFRVSGRANTSCCVLWGATSLPQHSSSLSLSLSLLRALGCHEFAATQLLSLSLSLSLAAACFGVPRVCRNTAPLSLTRGGIEPGARLQRSRRQVLAGQGAGVLRAGGGARALLPRARVPGAGAPATQQLRIVTVGVSGGKSLTGPLRDARRFLSTRWYSVQETTRTALGFGICPSFKAHSVAPCQTLTLRFATFASL